MQIEQLHAVDGKGTDDDGAKFDIDMVIDELAFSECWHGYSWEQGKEKPREMIFPELKIPFQQDPEISPNPSPSQTSKIFVSRQLDYTINGTLKHETNEVEFTLKRHDDNHSTKFTGVLNK